MCRVRAAYKAVQRPRDLEKELPQCALGTLLMQWLKQVRDAVQPAAASCPGKLAAMYLQSLHVPELCLYYHHHHQITKLSHSINAIGPAPHRMPVL
jgi:hypothetical protein